MQQSLLSYITIQLCVSVTYVLSSSLNYQNIDELWTGRPTVY
jgi:hypothetical protein